MLRAFVLGQTKMKYNAEFIRAVALMQAHENDAAAERLFNVLFAAPANVQGTRTPDALLRDARSVSNTHVYGSDIRAVNASVGVPYPGWPYAVAWIKAVRSRVCCGLKEAKDLHDFVRDNPTVSQA